MADNYPSNTLYKIGNCAYSDRISAGMLNKRPTTSSIPVPKPDNLDKRVAMHSPFSLVDITIILALAIVAVVGYKYSPLLVPTADLTIKPAPGCILHKQACHANLPGGGRVELSITPHPIPVARPLQVSVTISGLVANKVEIDLAGVDMAMGFNRKTLAAESAERYIGDTILPVCVSGRMAWQATLVIETDRQRIAVPFLFEAPAEGDWHAPTSYVSPWKRRQMAIYRAGAMSANDYAPFRIFSSETAYP